VAEFSGFWTTGAATGDQQASGYTQAQWSTAQKIMAAVNGYEGVAADYANELAGTVTGANTVAINTGGAVVDGKWYDNGASVNVNIPSAVGGGNTRIDRIVLRCSWAGFTVRITRIAGTDAGSPAAPAVTTTSGTTFDITLYQALVDTGGTVTLTDERAFAYINTAEIADLAITAAKIAADAVETAKIKDVNVTQGKLAIGASKVTNRQGGGASDWSTAGTNNYAPSTARIQTGSISLTFDSMADLEVQAVTFPVAFS
jgi:hypothetical protein